MRSSFGLCFSLSALATIFSIALLSGNEPDSLFTLAGKITLAGVQGKFGHWTADIYQGRVFVAATENDSIEVLDLRTHALIASIPGVKEAQSVAYAKSTNLLFATSAADGTLRSFDAGTFKPLSSARLGNNADQLRMDNSNDRLYAAYGEGGFSAFDANGKHLADLHLSAHVASFEVAQKQRRIFATLPDSHRVAVIDAAASQLLTEWPIKQNCENDSLAIDEDGRRVFVVCRLPAKLLVFNMDSGQLLASQPIMTGVGDLVFDPIHARLYAFGSAGQLATYNQDSPDHFSKAESFATGVGARTGLFVPEWNLLFVGIHDSGGHPAEVRLYTPR